MKIIKVYPNSWEVVPFRYMLHTNWTGLENEPRELILKNEMARSLDISEMTLNIDKFVAIDENGNEHHILGFESQNSVVLKGMPSGNFLRSSSVLSLPQGNYTALRFYLRGNGNAFTYNDGMEESADRFTSLDFAIENGLQIDHNEDCEVKLWFDFAPFQWTRNFKFLTSLFKKEKNPSPRLVNSFGQ